MAQALLIVTTLFVFASYLSIQYPKFEKQNAESGQLTNELAAKEREGDKLRAEIQNAESVEFVEEMAREIHGMIRSDERIFIIDN